MKTAARAEGGHRKSKGHGGYVGGRVGGRNGRRCAQRGGRGLTSFCGEMIILSMPFGPRLVRTASATARAAVMFDWRTDLPRVFCSLFSLDAMSKACSGLLSVAAGEVGGGLGVAANDAVITGPTRLSSLKS